MGTDYAKARWLPCKNFWPGGNTMAKVVIHGTASGGPQTGYQLATGAEFNDGQSASVTYINDIDGSVIQCVQESDSHWGNCCVYGAEAPAGYYPLPNTGNWHLRGLVNTGLPGSINHNHDTIAIENVKHDALNNDALSSAQYSSLVALVADICTRRKILPVKGSVIGHFDLDAVNKAHCPGTFDWPRFYKDLQIAMGYGPLPKDVLHTLAQNAGFTDTNLDIAVAIAQAESSGMPYRQGIVADGSLDRGVVQFNSHFHPEVTNAMAYDPQTAFKEMFRVSGGTNFNAWTTYTNGVYKQYMVQLTASGEVAVYPQSNQFENGESQSECGFFSNALAKAAAQPPNGTPVLDSEGVDQLADKHYVIWDGANTSANQNGMSIAAQEGMLNALGVPFTHTAIDANSAHSHDIALVSAWVSLGYSVIVTIPETSVYDMDVGGNPYSWVVANPPAWAGVTHIITVTGIDRRPGFAGHLLYRDTANYRSSPRTYSNDQIIFNRAIAINPSWLPRRADGFDPLVQTGGGTSVPLPTNWTQSTDTSGKIVLHNPTNTYVVTDVFAKQILSATSWDAADVPLENAQQLGIIEESNPALGGGWRQITNEHAMEWSFKLNRFIYGWTGQELMFVRKDRDAKAQSLTTALASNTTLAAQVADLTAKLAACQAAAPPPVPVPPTDPCVAVEAQLATSQADLATAQAALLHLGDVITQARTVLGGA